MEERNMKLRKEEEDRKKGRKVERNERRGEGE
jgi:hypothetical protein